MHLKQHSSNSQAFSVQFRYNEMHLNTTTSGIISLERPAIQNNIKRGLFRLEQKDRIKSSLFFKRYIFEDWLLNWNFVEPEKTKKLDF